MNLLTLLKYIRSLVVQGSKSSGACAAVQQQSSDGYIPESYQSAVGLENGRHSSDISTFGCGIHHHFPNACIFGISGLAFMNGRENALLTRNSCPMTLKAISKLNVPW
jgi:hypothetical protein